jgi:hypothetical protein
MEVYANLRDEISGIKGYVLLNLFGLDCSELNTEMYNRYDQNVFPQFLSDLLLYRDYPTRLDQLEEV